MGLSVLVVRELRFDGVPSATTGFEEKMDPVLTDLDVRNLAATQYLNLRFKRV